VTNPQALALTPAEAGALLREQLARAAEALLHGDLDATLDGYIPALGLALQLGPEPVEQTMLALLQAGRQLAQQGDAQSLSTLGPAVVHLVAQVRDAGALPATAVMDAWATVAADVGAFIGQVGLALALPPEHRPAMLHNARTRAALLDDATGHLLALTAWLDNL
jgi:hypothetical protein